MCLLMSCSRSRHTNILLRGSLIYEYIGEVVAEKTFRKRIQLYADEGIRHFYFMMLQKEEASGFIAYVTSLYSREADVVMIVYRRDQEGWHRTFRESLVQSQLRGTEMGCGPTITHGYLHQTRCGQG